MLQSTNSRVATHGTATTRRQPAHVTHYGAKKQQQRTQKQSESRNIENMNEKKDKRKEIEAKGEEGWEKESVKQSGVGKVVAVEDLEKETELKRTK